MRDVIYALLLLFGIAALIGLVITLMIPLADGHYSKYSASALGIIAGAYSILSGTEKRKFPGKTRYVINGMLYFTLEDGTAGRLKIIAGIILIGISIFFIFIK